MTRIYPRPLLPAVSAGTKSFADKLVAALSNDWSVLARESQRIPPGDWWTTFLILAGRGYGKTRTGAEFVREHVEAGTAKRVALVGATMDDVFQVMVEGESGLLAVCPEGNKPEWEPSKRRLTWPNGAIATCYSADEPNRLRGPQHDLAWCDEIAAWRYAVDAWDMLMFGLRLGKRPLCCATSTPKPVKLVRDLVKLEGKEVIVVRGSTDENAANLAPTFLNKIVSKYRGTRLGRQELNGELLEDVPGALFSRELIDAARVSSVPDLVRVVVAIDPSGSSNENSDETGIIVAGVDARGHGYILDDLSGIYSPTEWATKAIGAYRKWSADRIVAETNFGGDMVETTLRSVDSSIPFKKLTASRGKVVRAEPVSSFYEQNRVHHLGSLGTLEDQMCGFTSNFDKAKAGYSPDRVDALVWCLTELMVGESAQGWVDYYVAEVAKLNRPRPEPTSVIINPAPAPSGPSVKMIARAPFMRFAPEKGVMLKADANCIINSQPQHVKALIAAGCALADERERASAA